MKAFFFLSIDVKADKKKKKNCDAIENDLLKMAWVKWEPQVAELTSFGTKLSPNVARTETDLTPIE